MLRLATKGRAGFSARIGVKRITGASKLAYKHSESIERGAGMVSDVAGKASGALGTAATVAALTGFGAPVAAGLAAAGGAAGTLSAGAGMVSKGAGGVNRVKSANRAIDRFLG